MDAWSVIAICLVVPAVLFLLTAAAVSSLRMSRREARWLLLAGLVVLPVVVACVWMRGQPWLDSPWESVVDIAGNAAGLIVAYAMVAAVTRAVRHGIVPGGHGG